MPKRSETEFNENTVKGSKAKETRYQLRDRLRPGLILRIMPTGTKTWLAELERNCIRKVGDANLLNLSQAWTKAKKMQGDHLNGKTIKSSRNQCPTLQEFLTSKYQDFVEVEHKTGTSDAERLLAACKPLLNTRLDKLSEFQIEKWKLDRLKTAKPNTVKRDLGSLKGALNLAVKWGVIGMNPATPVIVKVPKEHRVRYLSDKEREQLLEALLERDKEKARARHSGNVFRIERGYETKPELGGFADYLHPLVRLTMNTGMRRGEVLSLKWDQVRLGTNPRLTVTASYSKSNKTRHIPLNSKAVDVLKKWKAQGNGEGWVFPNPNTGHRIQKLRRSWPNLMEAADI